MEVEQHLKIREDEDWRRHQCCLQACEGSLALLQPCHSPKWFHLQELIQWFRHLHECRHESAVVVAQAQECSHLSGVAWLRHVLDRLDLLRVCCNAVSTHQVSEEGQLSPAEVTLGWFDEHVGLPQPIKDFLQVLHMCLERAREHDDIVM